MIAIHGAYYNNNFGDLLLVKIFERWIKASGVDDIVYPLVPECDKQQFNIEFPDAKHGMTGSNCWKGLFYVGGGYFGEPQSNRGKWFRGDWNKRFLDVHLPPGEACVRNSVPYSILAVEAGPLSGLRVKRKVKWLCENAMEVAVRNVESQVFLTKKLNVAANVEIVPDAALTISLQDLPAKIQEQSAQRMLPYQNRVRLGIHHPSGFVGSNERRERMREGLISCLRANPDVLPIVFDDSGDSVSKSAKELSEVIRNATNRECLLIPFQGIWQTVALIGGLSAVLTTKLHVGIVSYAMGVYCESFASHQKTPRFYKLIQREGQCSFDAGITSAEVERRILRAIEMGRNRTSVINDTWHQVKSAAQKNQEHVNRLLSSI
ncbi:MAG: polysaccharide pyruvyl transferase family protein [Planctomycetales bacterium]|nr:polysaccharide pyruvyl transferase family protein [Planctomycetales bacterium]